MMSAVEEEEAQCDICKCSDNCSLQDYRLCNRRYDKKQDWVDEESLQNWYDDYLKAVAYGKGYLSGGEDAYKHGKWENSSYLTMDSAMCSNCKSKAYHYQYRGVREFYKYCPYCGAKMNKEEENGRTENN